MLGSITGGDAAAGNSSNSLAASSIVPGDGTIVVIVTDLINFVIPGDGTIVVIVCHSQVMEPLLSL